MVEHVNIVKPCFLFVESLTGEDTGDAGNCIDTYAYYISIFRINTTFFKNK